jgi:hypothetical protein
MIIIFCVKHLRVRHTLSGQTYGRKVLFVERALRYGEFGSHHVLGIECSYFVMMTSTYMTV